MAAGTPTKGGKVVPKRAPPNSVPTGYYGALPQRGGTGAWLPLGVASLRRRAGCEADRLMAAGLVAEALMAVAASGVELRVPEGSLGRSFFATEA